jgi:predicted kinase
MKLIMLNGASCSGKSTVIRNIMEKKDDLFYLHQDSIKWYFSKYTNKEHKEDVRKIVFSVAETIFNMNYDVICDSGLYKESREKLINLAKEKGYEVIEVNLEAEKDVLLERFNIRVENKENRRMSNTSVDRFKELLDIYNREKNPSAITFRTDNESIDEITKKLMSFLL